MKVATKLKAFTVLGLAVLVVGLAQGLLQAPLNEPEFNRGPDKPNWQDPHRSCTNLTLVVELVTNKAGVPDRVTANVTASLGSAGPLRKPAVVLYDLYRHPMKIFRHEFCANSGEALHALVAMHVGFSPVSDLTCSFYKGPDPEHDDVTKMRPAAEDGLTTTWCAGVAP